MFPYKIPLPLLLLWIVVAIFVILECILVFQWGILSSHFLTFAPLLFLPVWIFGIDFIGTTRERDGVAPFFPAILTIVIASLGILFFHPSIIIWTMCTLWLFTLFRILDARILFLLALVFLGMVILFLGISDQNQAQLFSILLYYCLVLWVISELLSGTIVRIYGYFFSKVRTPQFLTEYVDALRGFSRYFILVMPFLLLVAMVWFMLQTDGWTLTIKYSVIELLAFLLFPALLFTPIDLSQPRRIRHENE